MPLERLVADAETVLRAPQTLTVWVLLALLVAAAPAQAALAAAVVHVAAAVVSPGLVTLAGVRVLRMLESVPMQGITFIVALSLLANSGRYAAVWTGLAGFILLRWGLLARAFDPVARIMRRPLYRLPVADQALRAVIVRYALARHVPLGELAAMERRILEIAAGRGRRA